MSPKFAATLIGVGLILQALVFYAFVAALTTQSFPGAGEEAHHVGTIMRGSLAGMSLLAGLVVFLVRRADPKIVKRVLFGCAIGFGVIGVIMLKTLLGKAAVVPLPAIAIYVLASIFAGYTAFRKF